MADEQSGVPLRRWRPFYGAFGAIDDAIEEAGGHPRAEFQDVRVRILKLLRAATDDGVAEQLCAVLDDAMAESLETLRVVPVPHSKLASTDLAGTVRALGNHGSARIRTLAGDVVRGWTVAIHGGATAVKEELHRLSGDWIPHQSISTVIAEGNARGSAVPATAAAEVRKMKLHEPSAKMLPAATVATTEEHKKPAKMMTKKPVVAQSERLEAKKPVIAQSKKLEAKKPVVTQNEKIDAKKPVITQSQKIDAKKPVVAQSQKMETTKRKLHEGYLEAKRLKRQHTIQKINDKEAPKLLEQSQEKMNGPARCRTSSGVRRSLLPSLQLS